MASDISSLLAEDRPSASAAEAARREAEIAAFAEAVLDGLARRPRSIPSRFLYDATGSALFEEITKLEEYYPTRTETKMLETFGAEIAEHAGDADILVEFGSGSSRKTSLLIDALDNLHTYVPIDVSESFLAEAAKRLVARHDGLTVKPLVGDFTRTRTLIGAPRGERLGFFSGSTIGNLTHAEAKAFLENAAQLLGRGSVFLIGVDLKKSLDILIPAYDDEDGVTAAFSLNLLARVNRELDGDFDTTRFAHCALYNEHKGRIEIYLESLTDQKVSVRGRSFSFARGERIHTENSHKYSVHEFQALAQHRRLAPHHGLDRRRRSLQPASPAIGLAARVCVFNLLRVFRFMLCSCAPARLRARAQTPAERALEWRLRLRLRSTTITRRSSAPISSQVTSSRGSDRTSPSISSLPITGSQAASAWRSPRARSPR